MFAIANEEINHNELKSRLMNRQAGALVTFEGWVREQNEGKAVVTLEYEAYEALCAREAMQIFLEAKEKFGVLEIFCIHRAGLLQIGDLAVWIGVTSKHRGPAFDACRYVIDEIKTRLPIWKKETYTDGESGWVNCQSHCSRSFEQQEAVQLH